MLSATEKEISDYTAEAFGDAIDIQSFINVGAAYALKCNTGVVLFVLGEPNTYKITLCLIDGDGARRKADILDSFEWMFSNTDAETLVGYIASDNLECLAMVPHTWGYTLEDDVSEHVKIYTVTKDRWNSERP